MSPIELTRVKVAAAALQRRAQTARLSLGVARQRLASLQGLASPDFGALLDQLPEPHPLPSENEVRHRAQSNPLIQEAEVQAKASEASIRTAKANRFPGITVSLGQTQFEDAGQSAWQMGVSVPMPLFDRNQGAAQAAAARVREARAQADAATQGRQGVLGVLYPQVQTMVQQLETFQQSILPWILPLTSTAFSRISACAATTVSQYHKILHPRGRSATRHSDPTAVPPADWQSAWRGHWQG